jgi:hypothetical protein
MKDNAVWKELIRSKYGNLAVGKIDIWEESLPLFSSLW